MTFDFFMGLLIGSLLIAVIAIIAWMLLAPRSRSGEITEWQEAAYEPTQPQPRAVTRLTKNDLTWEI